jgi:hypothetical protein
VRRRWGVVAAEAAALERWTGSSALQSTASPVRHDEVEGAAKV